MIMQPHTFVITRKDNSIYYGYYDGDTPLELYCLHEADAGLVGNIYAARVEKVAEDLGAAFLELAPGLTCYYTLPKNGRRPVLLSREHKKDKRPGSEDIDGIESVGIKKERKPGSQSSRKKGFKLYAGDIILVQITKDAVKSKLPAADSTISLAGKYFVLTLSDLRTGISKKITDLEERNRLASIIKPYLSNTYGIIARTNAAGVSGEELTKELSHLAASYTELMRKASIAPGKTLLHQQEPHYITYTMDLPKDELSRIVTDQKDIYESLITYFRTWQDSDILSLLTFYEDDYPLWKLYRMETHYDRALSKTVWLPSGGSIVIEPTEAMVVIDVNTAGVIKKKQKEDDLFYQINEEAAREIGRQLRLRNLSGIIIIDFINMRYEKHRKKLMACLREVCARDRIRTHVVDITALNLVEITRQKVRKPLYEQARPAFCGTNGRLRRPDQPFICQCQYIKD